MLAMAVSKGQNHRLLHDYFIPLICPPPNKIETKLNKTCTKSWTMGEGASGYWRRVEALIHRPGAPHAKMTSVLQEHIMGTLSTQWNMIQWHVDNVLRTNQKRTKMSVVKETRVQSSCCVITLQKRRWTLKMESAEHLQNTRSPFLFNPHVLETEKYKFSILTVCFF